MHGEKIGITNENRKKSDLVAEGSESPDWATVLLCRLLVVVVLCGTGFTFIVGFVQTVKLFFKHRQAVIFM